MLKLLKPFGVRREISKVESNFIDTSGYAFKDACRNSLAIFIVVLALKFDIIACRGC